MARLVIWMLGLLALIATAVGMYVMTPDLGGRRMDEPITYPDAPKGPVVDDYHGTAVPDPYRWLEDADHPDTVAWVEAENALTARLLDTPDRQALREDLAALYDYPRATAPIKRGARYFFTFNDGSQDQPILYVQDGLAGESRVLLDPNTLSRDGTAALTAVSPSEDGRLLAYAISHSGSDRQEIHVREVDSLEDRPDTLRWAKFTNLAWTPDGAGFYYTRFPEPGTVPPGDENYFAKVYYHTLGAPQSDDALVFERPEARDLVLGSALSDDGRWLVLTSFRGSSDDCEVHVLDRRTPGAEPRPLFVGFHAAYLFVDGVGDRLFFRTTSGAERGRLVAVDLSHGVPAPDDGGEAPSRVVVAEQPDTLTTAILVGERLVTVYLRNASDQVRLFGLDGAPAGEIVLPAPGSLSGLTGRPGDVELFLRFSSFTYPPAVYRYDLRLAALEPFGTAGVKALDPSKYDVEQVRYPSKDGTQVSMFLVHRSGLERDGERPVYLTGYGGFNISLTPQFDPAYFAWLDRGGVVAVANLRGGGEYGEAWHRAGMFERKQTVFDDFIAAAEWLIESGYTRRGKLAIEGASNGGLLVGAVMVQRPELFGAVVCRVPVADMLRYHRFTVGRFWISEYGSADDPEQFPYLYAYSPLHNVQDGVAYPPTLITTADTDDRVAPGMAKKFAARLQAATAPDGGPILIRVETKAGHGGGKPVSKIVDEEADIFAFLTKYLE
ncbi:MAG: prolyl oligopeptidase family protein [Vicinamibacterales bacterium]